MFLNLSNTKLDVFKVSKDLLLNCYKETKIFPSEEKFGIIQQIRRAALSVHLNIAEGCTRKSTAETKRFYEVARGSLVEVDTALDIAVELGYTTKEKLVEVSEFVIR